MLNRSALLSVSFLAFALQAVQSQEYRVLHHFAGGADDGAQPILGRLVQSGSTLYGMTAGGGGDDVGTVFRVNTDGAGFQVMHRFVSAGGGGHSPYGSPLLAGSALYGMASCEKTSASGILFRLGGDGTGFQVLHTFSDREGKWPYDSLIQSGDSLYGMCTYGGDNINSGWVGNGTIFRVNTDGMCFQLLRTFTGGDGSGPHGSLLPSGPTLYGTTLVGGNSGLGTIFKLNTAGGGFQVLHHFAGGARDGSLPYGTTLVQSGSTLYGMTKLGGATGNGTVFKMNTNGAGFQLLRSFAGGANDGAQPECGTLVLSGSTLYGMTTSGGAGGTVFQINTNGTSFQLLHRFTGGDGRQPWGSLLLSGSTLYGMTSAGGSQDKGVIFAMDLLPKLAISLDPTNVNVSWSTNFPEFGLESMGQLANGWKPEPGVTGFSATLPVAAGHQFYRLSLGPSVTDIDGNVYKSVIIGKQVWLAEDLRTTRYRNGDLIGTTSPAALDISRESAPKYQWAYGGDESKVATYGRLYTWFAATDSRKLAPAGWHVATEAEWATLISFLGGEKAAQGKLKEAGTTHWNSPNADATNESGFTARPGGNRFSPDGFLGLGEYTHWWTATAYDAQYAWRRTLWKNAPMDTTGGYADKKTGWLVRCVRDTPALRSASLGARENLHASRSTEQ